MVTQSIFFGALLWCWWQSHSLAARTDGISYYGVHANTLPVIGVGFLIASAGLWRASTYFAQVGEGRWLVRALQTVAVSLVSLLVTPYTGGTFLNWAHMTLGVVGALAQLVIAMSLVRRDRRPLTVSIFVIQLVAGGVAAAALPDWHFPFLLQGEAGYELGFALVLWRWIFLSPDPRREQLLTSLT